MNIIQGDCKQIVTRASLKQQSSGGAKEFKALTVNVQEEEKLPVKGKFLERKRLADNNNDEFDMKKARNEVLNFSMARQRVGKNHTKMQIFQAIKLGAKPQKKACKNYKDLQAERKRLKDIREQRLKSHQVGKYQASLAAAKHTRKINKEKQSKQGKQRVPYTDIDRHYGSVHQPAKKDNKIMMRKR